MLKWSAILLFLGLTIGLFSQSPHGSEFKMNCAACHTSDSWEIPMEHWRFYEFPEVKVSEMTGWVMESDTMFFNHFNTEFPLLASHKYIDCRLCHPTLVFSEAETTCFSCHEDMHSQSVGNDCARCHNVENWLVDNIPELHEQNGFPLVAPHNNLSCVDCHTDASNLRFDRLGNDCVNCHLDDFQNTSNPDHETLGFSTDCTSCHTLETEWQPAGFTDHDAQFFPVYSGAHEGHWSDCIDCHTDPDNFSTFSCVTCHANPATDMAHTSVDNYVYEDLACLACHPSGDTESIFDHNTTEFPLTGAHISVDCLECHQEGFAGTSTNCIDCHTQDYTATQNPDHETLNLPTDCAQCHTTDPEWMPASFDIHDDFYPLNGAHEAIANNCAACHNGDYTNTPNTCAGCHQEDFDNTTDPNHQQAQFNTDCVMCHNENAWVPADYDHDGEHFPIYSGAHEGHWSECIDCHTNTDNYAEVSCINCHINPETDDAHTLVNGYIYNDPACLSCHPMGDADMPFDHSTTDFPLTGAHIGVDCLECHENGFEGTSTNCADCHTMDFNSAINPNHQELNLPTDCAQCHTTDPDWIPASFDIHNDFYPLNGAHAIIANDCAVCHNGDYVNTPNTCVGCHLEDFNNTTDPDHQEANFSNDCTTCHTEDAWIPSSFDHDVIYPLQGAHALIADECIQCHAEGYANTPNTCIGCHQENFDNTTEPNHTDAGFSIDCTTCHTEDAWIPSSFDHDVIYPLQGAHALIADQCVQCHAEGYANTPNTCVGCHQEDFDNTTAPNHQQAQFNTDCVMCHNENEWVPADFDHDGEHFPIYSGAHDGHWNECIDCHTNPDNYAEVSCINCHINPETDDAHTLVNGYIYNDPACLACHPMGDADMPFDHNATAFPLTGAHIGVDCLECHENGFEGTSTNCADCHTLDYNSAINPNHQELNLPTDCAQCHTTDPEWIPASFDIHNDFHPLNGAHAAIANDCAVCHNGDYVNTPNTCVGCHLEDFNNTTDPNHQEVNFSNDCTTCHTEDAWTPTNFDHDVIYPLQGAHALIADQCVQCHAEGYANTPNTCIGCHQENFDNTTEPNHTDAGFSTDCTTCHTEDAWIPSSFDHDIIYPLQGAHALIADQCVQCHAEGYANTPNTCVGCHQEGFDNTTDPNHQQAQFNTDCVMCHNEDAWVPADFDHDGAYFPIYSGAHDGHWSDCIDCHTNPDNYAEVSCINCHINPETDDVHTLVNGYIYNDVACLACHPMGDADMPFDHNATAFPLTGAHIGVDCLECHENGFEGTSTNCADCHTLDYNSAINPNHQELNLPTDCAQCHTTDPDWMPASFDIHNDFYPLNGAHAAIANVCAVCHNGDYVNTPNTCVGCHLEDFNNTTDPNHQEVNFSNDCTTCHTEDAWTPTTFDHDVIYPLQGAHALIADQCVQCHAEGYTNTPNTCIGCHQENYDNTTDPNHQQAQFNTDCVMCHNENAWVPADFDHDGEYFPIYSGAHDGHWGECIDCHTNPDNYAQVSCINCHINPETDDAHTLVNGYIYNDVACLACHPTGDATNSFDHNATNFPLTGAHIGVDCLECHESGYTGTPTDCNFCHNMDFQASTNPNHNVLGIPTDCAQCHTTEPGWAPASFDIHDNYYPLTGEHLTIANDCAACHNGDYNNTPNDCAGCHQTDYNNSVNPNHQQLNLPTDCAQCHTTDPNWMPASFDIHNDFYPLNGAHAAIANGCAVCHNGDYVNTPNTCIGCHLEDFNNTTDPNHQEANFSTDCTTCHTEDAWIPSTFDHDVIYPLQGAHALIADQCLQCHAAGYSNTPNTCAGCHQEDYNNTTNPNHQQAQFNTDCVMCHNENAWMPAEFDHDGEYFPIYSGAHAGHWGECIDCHTNPDNYAQVSCINCHINPETDDAHTLVNGYIYNDVACLACHPTGDATNSFDHNATNFPLTGAHIGVDCLECHESGYAGTPTDCNFCHNMDFQASTNPNHNVLGIPTDCAQCHTTEPGWAPASFDIHDNYYPLTGEHLTIANDCAACHNGEYNNTPNDCAGCHQTDYNNSVNPNHQQLNLPTDCTQCHTTDPNWMPASFDIHNDFYALNGAHAAIANDCAGCHNGDYVNTPNTCVGCHLEDFNTTTNPNHTEANFSTDCATCHSEDAWIPSTFDHDAIYPLLGAHALISDQCLLCHADGYDNTPNTCVGCHLDDYNLTDDPNHAQAQFPTDCLECHSENAWIPSSFDHDGQFFPIFSGKHKDEWILCTDCHFNTSDYSVFNCLDCHQHNNQSEVDAAHSEVNGYIYESNACFACHPEGEN